MGAGEAYDGPALVSPLPRTKKLPRRGVSFPGLLLERSAWKPRKVPGKTLGTWRLPGISPGRVYKSRVLESYGRSKTGKAQNGKPKWPWSQSSGEIRGRRSRRSPTWSGPEQLDLNLFRQICPPFLTVTVVSRRKPFCSFPEDDQFCSLDSIDFSLILYPEFVLPALIPFPWLLVCVLCSTFSPIVIPRKSLLSPLINKVYFFSPFSNLLMKRTDPS